MKNNYPKPQKLTLAQAEALAARDKRRIITMAIGALILGGCFLYTRFQAPKGDSLQSKLDGHSGEELVAATELYIPPFKDRTPLEDINDASEEQRLVVNGPALRSVLRYSLALTTEHFVAMGLAPMNQDNASALQASPSEQRLDPYRARGVVTDLRERSTEGASGGRAWFGTLRTEDDTNVHFVVDHDPAREKVEQGSFARLDGLFLQLHRTEIGPEWVDAPLLVGRSLGASHPYLKLDEHLYTPALVGLQDDNIDVHTGVPYDAQWELMAKVTQDAGQIDWDNAPTLNALLLNQIFENGEAYRGKPFIVPISKNMDTRTVTMADDNPLHMNAVSAGWIGNYAWKGQAGLVQWVGPFVDETLHDWEGSAELISGRGLFLKNVLYEARDGNPGRVPYFVMQDIQVHTPIPDPAAAMLLRAVFGGTVFLLGLIIWLLRRERKGAVKLQEELTRRRVARRAAGKSDMPIHQA
ncbi:MAG: hypothetical protein ACI8QC_002062 [Planctomycetota bacterium]|jgi:hypothetical protein